MKLEEVNSIPKLAITLRCKPEILELIYNSSYTIISDLAEVTTQEYINNPALVRTYTIEKKGKNKGKRNIYVPVAHPLKNLLKILSRKLAFSYKPCDNVHGFVKKRNIISNANSHLGQNYLLQVDIENFFGQITIAKIKDSLLLIGLHEVAADIISKISTINGVLVQGFSTSPILSNIVAIQLDEALIAYSINAKLVFTRYADDISISSTQSHPNETQIREIIESYDFTLNESKTKKSIRGNNQCITGLTVFDKSKARIPKKVKKNLRLEVYYIAKYGLKNHVIRKLVKQKEYNKAENKEEIVKSEIIATRYRIMGWIRFCRGVEPNFSYYLERLFESRNNRNPP